MTLDRAAGLQVCPNHPLERQERRAELARAPTIGAKISSRPAHGCSLKRTGCCLATAAALLACQRLLMDRGVVLAAAEAAGRLPAGDRRRGRPSSARVHLDGRIRCRRIRPRSPAISRGLRGQSDPLLAPLAPQAPCPRPPWPWRVAGTARAAIVGPGAQPRSLADKTGC